MAFIFSENEELEIIAAIQQAESCTTGEIRLHVEPYCKTENMESEVDAFERGLQLFAELGMHRTKAQNGVLFYLAYESHKFAIIADVGINSKVSEDFWEHIKDQMEVDFKAKHFLKGITAAIEAAGEQLSLYFPIIDDINNTNELVNDISKS